MKKIGIKKAVLVIITTIITTIIITIRFIR